MNPDEEARRILDAWESGDYASPHDRTVAAYARRLEAETERLRTERTECEADLNAARARAELAGERITELVAQVDAARAELDLERAVYGERGRREVALEAAVVGLVKATSLLGRDDGTSDALFTVLDRRVYACDVLGIDPASPEASATLDEGNR